MQIITQLSVFLENRPGTLAAVCEELARLKVNIYALTISDTVDHSVVRMVVSDTRRALMMLGEHGTMVVENEVIMLENDNKPGKLGGIAKTLSKAKVNIEYAYLATSPSSKKGLLILRPSNVKKALQALQEAEAGVE